MTSRSDQVRAVALLVVYGMVFVLSTPGLDSLPQSSAQLERALSSTSDPFPEPLPSVARGAMWVEERVRRPLEASLKHLQRPLRLEQSWSLYGRGPRAQHRMEIRVDGVLVHRTGDPEHAWLSAQLRHRRIRPMVESVVTKPDPANRVGLERYILTRARAAWPGVQRLSLRFVRTPYPPADPVVYRVRSASAPEWVFETDLPLEGP